jgi:hypothetical protein
VERLNSDTNILLADFNMRLKPIQVKAKARSSHYHYARKKQQIRRSCLVCISFPLPIIPLPFSGWQGNDRQGGIILKGRTLL